MLIWGPVLGSRNTWWLLWTNVLEELPGAVRRREEPSWSLCTLKVSECQAQMFTTSSVGLLIWAASWHMLWKGPAGVTMEKAS